MNLNDITPLILTYNEEENLARTLNALAWANQIVVVDSNSTDKTREIAESCPRTRLIEREFDGHANQWNFGLEQVETNWTLALDADYVCDDSLRHELELLDPQFAAYSADFVYAIAGRPLRATLYPERVVLFRTGEFSYFQDGHTQLLNLRGTSCARLRSRITHDDRKPLNRWLRSQRKYAELEAGKLLAADIDTLGWKDRLRRKIVWAPPLTFAYCMFVKRLIIEGWPGIYYSFQRTYAELLLSLELLERRLGPPPVDRPNQKRSEPHIEEGIAR